jgi:phosphopentomutase
VESEFGSLSVADLEAGEILRIQITRLASDAADTMSGDWELVSVVVEEA